MTSGHTQSGARKLMLALLVGALLTSILVATSGNSRAQATLVAAHPTPGVTAHTIRVQGILEETSSIGVNWTDGGIGAKIVFDRVNAAGGIYGRKIDDLGAIDDGGTNAGDTAAAQKVAYDDNVFAVVPYETVAEFVGTSVLIPKDIPFFGWSVAPDWCNNAQGFGWSGCTGPKNPNTATKANLEAVKEIDPGAKTVAIEANDNISSDKGMTQEAAAAKALGMKVVFENGTVPNTCVTNWTAFVQPIVALNPSVVLSESGGSCTTSLKQALTAAGYKGIAIDQVNYYPGALNTPTARAALDGTYEGSQFVPFGTKSNPGIKQLLSTVAKYAPGTPLTGSFAWGYLGAELFVALLKAAGPHLTYKTFYKAANHSHFTYNYDGMACPVSYPAGHSKYFEGGALVKNVGSNFVTAAKYVCTGAEG